MIKHHCALLPLFMFVCTADQPALLLLALPARPNRVCIIKVNVTPRQPSLHPALSPAGTPLVMITSPS